MNFNFINGISISYFSIGLLCIVFGLIFGINISLLVQHIFTPYTLDFYHLCCLDRGIFVKYLFCGIFGFIIIFYIVCGLTKRKWLHISAIVLGVSTVLIWYGLAFIFLIISGLEH
jgi:hypothetical protein